MARTHRAEIARREHDLFASLEEAVRLPHRSVHLLGLRLSDTRMTFEEWQGIGRILGVGRRWFAFALGDWLNFGEAIFGEDAAQAVEGFPADRYDIAHRITGLEEGTLRNYSSVCGRVALDRRRVELDFGHHEAVAALEPDEQAHWLQRAVDEAMPRDELRRSIREERHPAASANGDGPSRGEVVLSRHDRLELAARAVFQTWQAAGDGSYIVPGESAARLIEALGEE